MPMTTNKKLLALRDAEFWVDMGHDGGLICPVCMEWLMDEGGWQGACPHLLREYLDVSGSSTERACWVRSETTDDDAEDAWTFDPKLADKKKDSFLLTKEWVPVKVEESDAGSVWSGWFAVPVDILKKRGKAPKAIVEAMMEKAKKKVAKDRGEDEG